VSIRLSQSPPKQLPPASLFSSSSYLTLSPVYSELPSSSPSEPQASQSACLTTLNRSNLNTLLSHHHGTLSGTSATSATSTSTRRPINVLSNIHTQLTSSRAITEATAGAIMSSSNREAMVLAMVNHHRHTTATKQWSMELLVQSGV
jgi:hypothetical protein